MLQEATFSMIGNVGKVEVNDAGTKARLSLAVNVRWRDGDQTRERTDWYDVSAFQGRVDFIRKYVTTGRYLRITGTMRPNQYEKEGQKHYTLDLIADQIDFLDKAPQT